MTAPHADPAQLKLPNHTNIKYKLTFTYIRREIEQQQKKRRKRTFFNQKSAVFRSCRQTQTVLLVLTHFSSRRAIGYFVFGANKLLVT